MKQRNRNDMLSQLQFLGMYVAYEDSCNKDEKIIKYFSAHVSYRYYCLGGILTEVRCPNSWLAKQGFSDAKLKADFGSFKAKTLKIGKLV